MSDLKPWGTAPRSVPTVPGGITNSIASEGLCSALFHELAGPRGRLASNAGKPARCRRALCDFCAEEVDGGGPGDDEGIDRERNPGDGHEHRDQERGRGDRRRDDSGSEP